jgi:DNA-binding MarR family transcriptional regulator
MGRVLMRRLEQSRPFANAVEEATVNLLVTASWLDDRVERTLAPLGITHRQYNVLRILRGTHPEGHPRCEIARRMIDRAPDVTRIIDRLEKAGLVERGSDPEDGRRSVTRLTRSGVSLLAKATEALEPLQKLLTHRLSARSAHDLSRICEALYGPDLE